jgi:uncharacterized protein YggE
LAGSVGGRSESTDESNARDTLTRTIRLKPEEVKGFISIQGQAEQRVKPTEIRMVIAVTAEAKNPAECNQVLFSKLDAVKAAWSQAGIPEDRIVDDFIAMLPRYEFAIERVGEREAAVEKLAGYRVQSNLHVSLNDDAQAATAIAIAFGHNIPDIIAFDYWSSELDQAKTQARAEALRAAREKSDALLGDLFEQPLKPINLQESTVVVYPESMYQSFENTYGQDFENWWDRPLPVIRIFKPKNTYYRGLYPNADVTASALPLRCEISVVSTVILYYQSPADKSPETPPLKEQ